MIPRALVVMLLGATVAACAAKAAGPAWPAPSEREDGGESLAPHKPTEIEASMDDAEPEEAAPEPAKAQPTAHAAAPAPTRRADAVDPKPKPPIKQPPPEPKPTEILAPPPRKRHDI